MQTKCVALRPRKLTLETAGVCLVCAHLAVHFDEALHDDLLALVIGEGVLQTVTQQDGHGQALSRPVRSGAGLGGLEVSQVIRIQFTSTNCVQQHGTCWLDERTESDCREG